MNALTRSRLRQTAAVFRLEIGKTLFSRRGLWIYLLAALPVLLFVLAGIFAGHRAAERAAWIASETAARHGQPLTAADLGAIQTGMSEADVRQRLGPPADFDTFSFPSRTPQGRRVRVHGLNLYYAVPEANYEIGLLDGKVDAIRSRSTPGFSELVTAFASVYQFFMLRLAIFFGCLGIFMNLFRGELLDKSLHFYFLAPMRREVVLAGKFLAGLGAAALIFLASVVVQILVLGAQLPAPARAEFLSVQHGWHQIAAYLAVTLLACAAYGAFFCAAGLFTKNPILPAAILLVWEGINPFLPALLKKISIIYYLNALLPTRLNAAPGTPSLFSLLISDPDALAPVWATLGLLLVAAALLALAARRVRRLELDYTAE